MKKVSVITVVYNAAGSVERTLKSVLSQDFDNFEYIIIDGGSKDGTLDVIGKYRTKIDLIISEKDRGVYDAMNKGIQKANGEWIVFMNAGDTFAEDKTLSTIFSSESDYSSDSVIYGDTINCHGDHFVTVKARNISLLDYRMPFCHQSTYVRTSLVKEKGFDLTYRYAADYELFHRLYDAGHHFAYLPQNLSIYYLEGGLTSQNIIKLYKEESSISGKRDLHWLLYGFHVYFSAFVHRVVPSRFIQLLKNKND